MRLALTLVIITLLILSSCTYLEGLGDFVGISADDDNKEVPEPEPTPECNDDMDCISSFLKECKHATGTLSLNFDQGPETGRIEILGHGKDSCGFDYTAITSYNPDFDGKTITCNVPDALLEHSFEDILDTETGVCAGDFARTNKIVFDKKTIFSNEGVYVEDDFITFSLKNEYENIYLTRIEIAGKYFTDCILTFKRPYIFSKNEKKEFDIGCSKVTGAYNNYPGTIKIDYMYGQQNLSLTGYFSAERIT